MNPRIAGQGLATLLLLTAATARGEPPPPSPDPDPPRMVTVDNSRGMLYTGIGLTAAGAVAGGAGTALMVHTAENGNAYDFFGSLLLTIFGGALFCTGVPLWIAGEWDVEVPEDDPRAVRNRASVSLSVAPGGAGLVGRF